MPLNFFLHHGIFIVNNKRHEGLESALNAFFYYSPEVAHIDRKLLVITFEQLTSKIRTLTEFSFSAIPLFEPSAPAEKV